MGDRLQYHIIVATDVYNGFSKDNKIPWSLKKDMQFFRKQTLDAPFLKKNVVIMGRNTFEAMNYKPLKGRINIILTRNKNHIDLSKIRSTEEIYILSSIEEAIQYIHHTLVNIHHVYFIGGEEIYNQALEKISINTIYRTIVYQDYLCDRFFPMINLLKFQRIQFTEPEQEGDVIFHFEIWKSV